MSRFTKNISPQVTKEDPFIRLQNLLFEKDREVQEEIRTELNLLATKMEDPEEISRRVSPFIDHKVDFLKDHFPELFGEIITETIRKQIAESQDQMVDALYPIIGKLIKKYLVKEFEALSERIDMSVKKTFSFATWKNQVINWFSGVKNEDVIKSELMKGKIQEIFIIEKDSGLLMATYSIEDLVDEDMVAGMLSAIKSFTEDAFNSHSEDLETIEYQTNKILLLSLKTYYYAVVISGTVNTRFKQLLSDFLMEFSQKEKLTKQVEISEDFQKELSKKLEVAIHEFSEKNK